MVALIRHSTIVTVLCSISYNYSRSVMQTTTFYIKVLKDQVIMLVSKDECFSNNTSKANNFITTTKNCKLTLQETRKKPRQFWWSNIRGIRK